MFDNLNLFAKSIYLIGFQKYSKLKEDQVNSLDLIKEKTIKIRFHGDL